MASRLYYWDSGSLPASGRKRAAPPQSPPMNLKTLEERIHLLDESFSTLDVTKKSWKVTCSLSYKQNTGIVNKNRRLGDDRLYKVVSSAEEKCFLLLGEKFLAADDDFLAILLKLSSFSPRIETVVEGTEYVIGEVALRAGSFKRRNNTADIVVFEIEYLERLKPGGTALILDHYVRMLDIPRQADMVMLKPGSVFNLPDAFGPSHLALQHIRLFESLTDASKSARTQTQTSRGNR